MKLEKDIQNRDILREESFPKSFYLKASPTTRDSKNCINALKYLGLILNECNLNDVINPKDIVAVDTKLMSEYFPRIVPVHGVDLNQFICQHHNIESNDDRVKVVVLYGQPGCGKSRAIVESINYCKERHRDKKVLYPVITFNNICQPCSLEKEFISKNLQSVLVLRLLFYYTAANLSGKKTYEEWLSEFKALLNKNSLLDIFSKIELSDMLRVLADIYSVTRICLYVDETMTLFNRGYMDLDQIRLLMRSAYDLQSESYSVIFTSFSTTIFGKDFNQEGRLLTPSGRVVHGIFLMDLNPDFAIECYKRNNFLKLTNDELIILSSVIGGTPRLILYGCEQLRAEQPVNRLADVINNCLVKLHSQYDGFQGISKEIVQAVVLGEAVLKDNFSSFCQKGVIVSSQECSNGTLILPYMSHAYLLGIAFNYGVDSSLYKLMSISLRNISNVFEELCFWRLAFHLETLIGPYPFYISQLFPNYVCINGEAHKWRVHIGSVKVCACKENAFPFKSWFFKQFEIGTAVLVQPESNFESGVDFYIVFVLPDKKIYALGIQNKDTISNTKIEGVSVPIMYGNFLKRMNNAGFKSSELCLVILSTMNLPEYFLGNRLPQNKMSFNKLHEWCKRSDNLNILAVPGNDCRVKSWLGPTLENLLAHYHAVCRKRYYPRLEFEGPHEEPIIEHGFGSFEDITNPPDLDTDFEKLAEIKLKFNNPFSMHPGGLYINTSNLKMQDLVPFLPKNWPEPEMLAWHILSNRPLTGFANWDAILRIASSYFHSKPDFKLQLPAAELLAPIIFECE